MAFRDGSATGSPCSVSVSDLHFNCFLWFGVSRPAVVSVWAMGASFAFKARELGFISSSLSMSSKFSLAIGEPSVEKSGDSGLVAADSRVNNHLFFSATASSDRIILILLDRISEHINNSKICDFEAFGGSFFLQPCCGIVHTVEIGAFLRFVTLQVGLILLCKTLLCLFDADRSGVERFKDNGTVACRLFLSYTLSNLPQLLSSPM